MEKDICIEELKDMKKCLTSKFKSYMDGGLDCVDTHEAYEIADIIKDLAETERNCYEACYYKKVIEAMEDGDEPDIYGYSRNRRMGYRPYFDGDIDIYGYNATGYNGSNGNGRNSSSSNSNGGRMGYKPYVDQEPYIQNYISDKDGFRRDMQGSNSLYGREYDDWKSAKRHYTETKSSADKSKMDEHTAKHVDNVVMSLKEMWTDADPSLRQKMKAELTALVGTM